MLIKEILLLTISRLLAGGCLTVPFGDGYDLDHKNILPSSFRRSTLIVFIIFLCVLVPNFILFLVLYLSSEYHFICHMFPKLCFVRFSCFSYFLGQYFRGSIFKCQNHFSMYKIDLYELICMILSLSLFISDVGSLSSWSERCSSILY